MKELELFGLASVGGWLKWKRKQADIPPGTPCTNCETELVGTYCHACGQLAENFHKPFFKLGEEVLESFFHLDGRLFRTIPDLLIRPGRLTRRYLDGMRAYQVPPFRLFLVVIILAFFVGHLAIGKPSSIITTSDTPESTGAAIEAAMPSVRVDSSGSSAAIAEIRADDSMTEREKDQAIAVIQGDWRKFGRMVKADVDEARVNAPPATAAPTELEAWLEKRVKAIQEDPRRFGMVMETWAQRVIVLALPISALILSLLFVFNRRFFVFDHLIFSMHSLSFQLILVTLILLFEKLVGGVAWWLILLSPVHLFVHMRGAYESGVWMTLLRMFLLWILTVIGFSFLGLLWLYLGVNEMGG